MAATLALAHLARWAHGARATRRPVAATLTAPLRRRRPPQSPAFPFSAGCLVVTATGCVCGGCGARSGVGGCPPYALREPRPHSPHPPLSLARAGLLPVREPQF
jgi:hypothetical protein